MAAPRLTSLTRARSARRVQELGGMPAAQAEHRGRARLGKRTKLLVRRLKHGDIAVIDHEDIDRVAADDLVRLGIRCVLNAACSSTGRYPNSGPMVLCEAGVHMVDFQDTPLFDLLEDGDDVV